MRNANKTNLNCELTSEAHALQLSGHGAVRVQQRGISEAVIDLLMQFGGEQPAGQGAVSISADRDSLREIRAAIGAKRYGALEQQLRSVYLIVADGVLVTAAHVH